MKYRRALQKVLVTVVVMFVAITAIFHFQRYHELRQTSLSQISQQALNYLEYTDREYQRALNEFRSMATLIANSKPLYDYAQTKTEYHKQALTEQWQTLLSNQQSYYKLAFIDAQGQETLCVFPPHSKFAHQTRAQSQPEFFAYAQTLSDHQIGYWENRPWTSDDHNGVKELDIKLIYPLTIEAQREGYLVLDLNMESLSQRVNYSPDLLLRADLLDQNGGYLIKGGHGVERVHTSNIGKRLHAATNIADVQPKTWQKMQEFEDGFVKEHGVLTVFKTLNLIEATPLHLAISLSPDELTGLAQEAIEALNRETGLAILLGLLFIVPTTFMLMYYRRNSIDSHLARAALSGMSAVMIIDRYCKTVLVNPEFTRLTGLSSAYVESKNVLKGLLGERKAELFKQIFADVREHDIWEDEVTLYQGESEITTIMRVQSSFDSKGKLSYYIVSFVDISERKVLEEKLRVLSEKDPMSDLWNRRKFEQELRRSALLAQLADSNKPTCLALIDIDHFKRINDELGHDEGDRIISRVSYVMSSVVRHSDFLARIGGEEFAVIMPNTSIADANMALNRIREQVEIDTQASVTVSVGFTQLTPDYTRSYKCADIALYESKTIGRNQVSLCLDCEDIA